MAAKRAAEVTRAMLDADAAAEYAEHGTAPTWRSPDFTVTAAVKSGGPVVVDDAAFLRWVKVAHPDEVETLERVRPAFVTALLATASRLGEPCDSDGTVVEGMGWRDGGEYSHIAVKPSASLRARLDDFGAAIEAGVLPFALPMAGEAA